VDEFLDAALARFGPVFVMTWKEKHPAVGLVTNSLFRTFSSILGSKIGSDVIHGSAYYQASSHAQCVVIIRTSNGWRRKFLIQQDCGFLVS
jgi:hypothetical protein